MKKYILLIVTTLISANGYCQYNSVTFETDSTKVELTKNSEYRIWEETYKDKDSVFYSVRFIKDTTQVHLEGWSKKNEQQFGKWSEYKIDGTWLYTIDYTNHSWKYNKDEFKYQTLKDTIKAKADKLLLNKFGEEFFHNNIVFNFYGNTYIKKKKVNDTGVFEIQDTYLGSWTEPIHQKPNSFIIEYTVALSDHEFYNVLEIELDSVGNRIPRFSIFDKIKLNQKQKFSISKEKAIQICENNIIKESSADYQVSLKFGYRKETEYSGKFYYEVMQPYDQLKDENCKDNCKIINFYNVWRFDPWTSKLLFKKPMKRILELNRGCLTSTYFIEVKE